MQVVGDFYVTNASEQPILVTSATLKVWRRRFWVVPYRLKILGVVHVRSPNSRAFGSYSIPPNFTTDARAMWFPKPPFVMPGRYFMARACFVDQLGHEHWTRKLRWHSLSQTSQQPTASRFPAQFLPRPTARWLPDPEFWDWIRRRAKPHNAAEEKLAATTWGRELLPFLRRAWATSGEFAIDYAHGKMQAGEAKMRAAPEGPPVPAVHALIDWTRKSSRLRAIRSRTFLRRCAGAGIRPRRSFTT